MRSVRRVTHVPARSTVTEVDGVSDDDWFERALDEASDEETDDSESEDGERSADAEAPSEIGDRENAGADPGGIEREADRGESEFGGDADTDAGFGTDSGTDTGFGDAGGADGFGDTSETDPGFGDDADTDSGFGPDAEGGDVVGDDRDAGDGPDGEADGFADADPYEASDDEGLFDEDFSTAFENAPGGGGAGGDTEFGDAGLGDAAPEGFGGDDAGFGMGGGGGFGETDEPFEETEFDEEFESSIPRVDVGIEGLDSMIQGGVPERSLLTTIGSAGTGKTTFGLQFLNEALEAGENAVFITLEESRGRIINTATEKGWSFDDYESEGRLAVIDLDPIEMANSLTSIRNDLPRLIEDFGASRLVLDSVSLLEMMYDEQATRRNEVYDFTRSLKQAGVTTMLTSEASEENSYASRHGIIEYLVDAVFILRYIRSSDDFRETRLAVEIQKIRDANHSREIKPYSITNDGISVYRQANIF